MKPLVAYLGRHVIRHQHSSDDENTDIEMKITYLIYRYRCGSTSSVGYRVTKFRPNMFFLSITEPRLYEEEWRTRLCENASTWRYCEKP